MKQYNFKHLKYNGERVFAPNGALFDFYQPQNCEKCGHCSNGYYRNITHIQSFACIKCGHRWDIASENGKNAITEKVEMALFEIDKNLEILSKLNTNLKVNK